MEQWNEWTAMGKQQQQLVELYTKHAIVAEQRLTLNVRDLQTCNCSYGAANHRFTHYYCQHGSRSEIPKSNLNVNSAHTFEWIDGKKWEFTFDSATKQCQLTLVGLKPNQQVMAEVIFWKWHGGKEVHISKKNAVQFRQSGNNLFFTSNATPSDGVFNVLIRVLAQKEHFANSFPPLNEHDEVILKVGIEQFTVSKGYLTSVSPVFKKMFNTDMRESKSGEVVIKETSGELFAAFLEAISPKPTLPNPSNVMALLKLADHYEVDLLRDRCEEHLINCVEIALIDRLICADTYRLDKLKNYILANLSAAGLAAFYKENEPVLISLSKETLIQLFAPKTG